MLRNPEGLTTTQFQPVDVRQKRYEFSLQYPKPLREEDLGAITAVARSGQFSRYASNLVPALEEELARYYGRRYAVCCSSGTAALHGCLAALQLPVGSEVITTSIVDIGVILPLVYENLIPVFADVNPATFNLDVASAAQHITSNTSAIIAVHLAGNPCDVEGLSRLCRKHRLVLIEDFSQAHGATWHGQHVGWVGRMAYGSLQQSKQITCGEGGVIVTDDKALARRALLGVDKGWQRHRDLRQRQYEFLASCYRFTALQGAVLKPQIERLSALMERKRRLAGVLRTALAPLSDIIRCQEILPGAQHAYYSFPTSVTRGGRLRNRLLNILDHEFNVRCAFGYANPVPIYRCANFLKEPQRYGRGLRYTARRYPPGLCPQAEELLKRSFLLPFNEQFEEQDLREIVRRLIGAIALAVSTNALAPAP